MTVNRAAWESLTPGQRAVIVGGFMGIAAGAATGLILSSLFYGEVCFLGVLLLMGLVGFGRFPDRAVLADDAYFAMARHARRVFLTFAFVIVACAVFALLHVFHALVWGVF